MNHTYHVAVNGSDANTGSVSAPFVTINHAASIARAGDTVIVHEGVYREWVDPLYGGRSHNERITYMAAPGEHVMIKGSEVINFWVPERDGVWKAIVSNQIFHEYNPYATELHGDWHLIPKDYRVHAGAVYMNGKAFYEAPSLEDVFAPKIRDARDYSLENMRDGVQPFAHPEDTLYVWYATVDTENTTIYANFQGADPNRTLTEINVRRSVFYPRALGINYITVRGFELAQAATPWAPPTADQPGLIGPHWALGWIIEDNIIHDAKCSAISLGKEISTGHNDCTASHRKPGYQYQLEAVMKAHRIGWDMSRIGSHIVRRNTIYDCGQNGIVGHLGCIRSTIYENHIYHIGTMREHFGWEIAAIKLHASLDCVIRRNLIHDCLLGVWLDWQAQGVRVTGNLLYANDRDLMVEVSHGPYLVDHNIMASDRNIENMSQGGAYVHNLFSDYIFTGTVLNRSTPYHYPHTTDVAGFALVYGGDDRYYQNLFAGGYEGDTSSEALGRYVGTGYYDGCCDSLEAYAQKVIDQGIGDLEMFERVRQPYYSGGNVYFGKARPADVEKDAIQYAEDPAFSISEEPDGIYLNLTLPENCVLTTPNSCLIDTARLGTTRISECAYENPDGSDLILDEDFLGNRRPQTPLSGPLEELTPGRNHIRLFDTVIHRLS